MSGAKFSAAFVQHVTVIDAPRSAAVKLAICLFSPQDQQLLILLTVQR